jgi:hypothetical protein
MNTFIIILGVLSGIIIGLDIHKRLKKYRETKNK